MKYYFDSQISPSALHYPLADIFRVWWNYILTMISQQYNPLADILGYDEIMTY